MPDVIDREKKESVLSTRIWNLWTEWTADIADPLGLRKDSLKSAARDSVMPVLERQFSDGAKAVTNQFGVKLDERRSAMLFLFWFSNWESYLADSWESRVRKYSQSEQKIPWEYVRGRGVAVKHVDGQWEPEPVALDPTDKRRVIGAKPLFSVSDADRVSVGAVTNSNTAGEIFGWRESERLGDSRIEAYWRTDVRPCKHCRKLEGEPSRVWRSIAPNGPMLHENCRCWLEFRRVLGVVPIGSRRSYKIFSMDGNKGRKFLGGDSQAL